MCHDASLMSSTTVNPKPCNDSLRVGKGEGVKGSEQGGGEREGGVREGGGEGEGGVREGGGEGEGE